MNTKSYWQKTVTMPTFSSLSGDLHVDVAVIGGGITGVTCALLLSQSGKRVALLEARRIGDGETGRTTAHLTEVVDTEYRVIAKKFGIASARFVAHTQRAAMHLIAKNVLDLKIRGFRGVNGYRIATREGDVHALLEECHVARECGLRATMAENVALPFRVEAAMLVEDQAELHPLEYLRGIVSALVENGGLVFDQTRAIDVHDGSPCTVTTESGTLSADSIVVATNVPLNRYFLQTKVAHYQTYAIAVRLTAHAPAGLYWDMCNPYHYVRSVAGADRLLVVGGADHKTGSARDTESRYDLLERWARARFPVESVEHRWSGQVIEPVDGLPYIGRNSLSSHVFIATGFSGNGMTFGTAAAQLLAERILGEENPRADLFDPTRITPVASAREFVTENVDYPLHLVTDRLRRPEAKSVEEVRPGEGMLVSVSGRRLAVYREPDGRLKALSPVCTHLGCHVHFNHAERTWDCPCHGSRFDVDGQVLNGPAVKALEKVPIPSEIRRAPHP